MALNFFPNITHLFMPHMLAGKNEAVGNSEMGNGRIIHLTVYRAQNTTHKILNQSSAMNTELK